MSAQEPTQVPPIITSQVKEKSPGRVAAGKRLAEISRAARERKKQEQNTGYGKPRESLFTYQNIFALVGISIGAAALFYELRPQPQAPVPVPTTVEIAPQTAARREASNLESFD